MKKTSLLLGASLFLPLSAFAGPSYNYIQGDYIVDGELEIENVSNNDFDGWHGKFSGAILPNLFIQGEHSQLDIDDSTADQDFTSFAVGGNVAIPISNKDLDLDVFGTVSYELLNDALDANGYGVTLGMRLLGFDRVEIAPFVGYVDYGSLEGFGGNGPELDGIRYGVEVIVNIIDCLALTASYRNSQLKFDVPGPTVDLDINDEIQVGLRLYL